MNITEKYIEILIKILLYLIESLITFLEIDVLCGNCRDTLFPSITVSASWGRSSHSSLSGSPLILVVVTVIVAETEGRHCLLQNRNKHFLELA